MCDGGCETTDCDELFCRPHGILSLLALRHIDAEHHDARDGSVWLANSLVGEARRLGMVRAQEAANLSDVPNLRQKGTRLGNWLTREQAKDLLAVPVRSTLKGKRNMA